MSTEVPDVKTRPEEGAHILVAGDRDDSMLLCDILRREGYAVARVYDGWAALDHVRQFSPDVALLDQDLSGLDGVDVCRLAKSDPATRLVPVLLISDPGGREERIKCIEAGADELVSRPVDACELTARVRSLVRVKRYTNDLELVAAVMMTLSSMIEARDRYSEGHCHRMANYAAALGRRMGLAGDDLEALRRGSFLHDIGMLAIPDSVLGKRTALEPHEYELVKSHTVIGESLIANMRSLQPVRSIVRHHHERLDGSGYPDGIKGDAITLPAQIVGLVDTYEAITTPRPYQAARSSAEAIQILRDQVRRGWRRHDLVEEFASLVHQINAAVHPEAPHARH
jgi:putative two-component system response regulator